MNKSRHVTFRCTQEQYDAIKAIAKEHQITLSDLILATLINFIEHRKDKP